MSEFMMFGARQSPVESLTEDINMFGRGSRRPSPEEFEQHKASVRERFRNLSPTDQAFFLKSNPSDFAELVGAPSEQNFQNQIGAPVQMPPEMRRAEPAYGVSKSTGIPGQGLQQLLGLMGPPRQQLQPGGMSGPSLMARLENVDNNVQQIARQLGVQNQPQRPNLPSAMQPMQGPPQGIMALLQQRQQQMMQADPMSLQQNQIAAQSRLQPTYMPQMQAQMPQAQMMQPQMMQAMAQQAPQSAALRALQSQQAYRGLAAGPFAFSMRR